MSNSSTTGTPNMKTQGTMVGDPKPGRSEKYQPATKSVKATHGMNTTGGNNSVSAKASSGSKADWASAGGNQSVKAK